jgi:MoxR-like ATPase
MALAVARAANGGGLIMASSPKDDSSNCSSGLALDRVAGTVYVEDALHNSRRARRGFCGMSRKAQNPRQAWTACLVLQRSVTHPLADAFAVRPMGRHGRPAVLGPQNRAPSGSAKNGPFAHQTARLCEQHRPRGLGGQIIPFFDSNAHGGSIGHHPQEFGYVRAMDTQAKIKALLSQLNSVIVGKPSQVQDGVACLLAGGHLLIEDAPGVGKTTLAHALARSFGLQFSRVQFTADLMPSDLSGVSIYDRNQNAFVFHPGPVFAQVLLADEINRASPKTQSALLEAMEERQVTIEGETRPLPSPFFVIATQNPQEQLGTHPLPESQLDRFLMRISLGYPDRASERELLAGRDRRDMLDKLPAVLTPQELQAVQQQVLAVHAAPPLLDYLQDLIAATRNGRWFVQGLSPRAGLAVLRAAKAQALLNARDYVAPDDVQAVLPQTAAHRLVPVASAGRGASEQVRAMLQAVPLP